MTKRAKIICIKVLLKIGEYDVANAKSVEQWLAEIEQSNFEHDPNN